MGGLKPSDDEGEDDIRIASVAGTGFGRRRFDAGERMCNEVF